jgi:hypothetical protein
MEVFGMFFGIQPQRSCNEIHKNKNRNTQDKDREEEEEN